MKKMNILNDGGQYKFFNELNIIEKLEPKNYVYNFNEEFNASWLEDGNDFTLPEKVYDINNDLIDYIDITYKTDDTNIGILLTGNKGQGKSLTAKQICKRLNLPVIIIGKSIPKSLNFIEFLTKIKQDHILFVDEFEKLFNDKNHSGNGENKDYHTQETFLSYMDGSLANTSRVVFLLTTNDAVNTYFLNRPSRIKFLKEYSEMDEELFHQIVDDRLINKEYKADLTDNISLININIDLLISIVNDINRFNQPFSKFSKYYNYVFEKYRYELYLTKKGKNEEFSAFFTLDKKIHQNINYINNHKVANIIKFDKNEIIFTTTYWDNEIEEEIEGTMRVVPMKMSTMTKVF